MTSYLCDAYHDEYEGDEEVSTVSFPYSPKATAYLKPVHDGGTAGSVNCCCTSF